MTFLGWCKRKKRREAAERTRLKQHEVDAAVSQANQKSGALYAQLSRLDTLLKQVERTR